MFTSPANNPAKFANPLNYIGYNYNWGGVGQFPYLANQSTYGANPTFTNPAFAIPGLASGNIVWTINLVVNPYTSGFGAPVWQNGQTVVATNNLGHTIYGQLLIDNFGSKLVTPFGVYSIFHGATNSPLFLHTLGCQANSLCGVNLIPSTPIGG